MSSAWTGTMSSVTSPSRLESSAGSQLNPVLSRSNQAGARDGREDEQDDRQRRGHRQHAPVPARDIEGHPQVDEDVGDLQELGSLQGVPAADRHDEDECRRGEQEQDDDGPARLARGLPAVGMLDPDVILGHAGRTIQSGAGPVRRFVRTGVGDAHRFGPMNSSSSATDSRRATATSRPLRVHLTPIASQLAQTSPDVLGAIAEDVSGPGPLVLTLSLTSDETTCVAVHEATEDGL